MASSNSNNESNHSSSEEEVTEEVAIERRTAKKIRSPTKAEWELVGPRRSHRSSSNSQASTSSTRAARTPDLASQEEFPPLQLLSSRSSSSGDVDPYSQVVTEAIR